MKKTWRPVKWEDIRAGDVVIGGLTDRKNKVVHIGDRYFFDKGISAGSHLRWRYEYDEKEKGENQWQRQETEKEPADYEAEIARLRGVIRDAQSFIGMRDEGDFRALCILDDEIDSWEGE